MGQVASAEDTRLTARRKDAHQKCADEHTTVVQPRKRIPDKQKGCHIILGQPANPHLPLARAPTYISIRLNFWCKMGMFRLPFALGWPLRCPLPCPLRLRGGSKGPSKS